MKEKDVPEVGKFYHFWDDGKIGLSRHYIAKVEKIIPFKEAENIVFQFEDGPASLLQLWKDEVEGAKWLYNQETDFFIECSIPKYDKDLIYFVRDIDNGWFSINTTSWWQTGRLNIDGSIYEEVLKTSSYELRKQHEAVTYD